MSDPLEAWVEKFGGHDPLLSAGQIACRLPSPRRGGGKLTAAAVRHWMRRGNSGVRLRTEPVGSQHMARMSWVMEYFQRVAAARELRRSQVRRRVAEAG
jgi:hypothetical protein